MDAHVERLLCEIREGKYVKIVFLVGAGVSPLTGQTVDTSAMYADADPQQWYEVLRAFCVDTEPTSFHELMHETGWKIYTQNVDELEMSPRLVADPDSYIGPQVEHVCGKLSNGGTCIKCGRKILWRLYKKQLEDTNVHCPNCGDHIRPNIVMHGETSSVDTAAIRSDLEQADLVVCSFANPTCSFADQLKHAKCPILIVSARTAETDSDRDPILHKIFTHTLI